VEIWIFCLSNFLELVRKKSSKIDRQTQFLSQVSIRYQSMATGTQYIFKQKSYKLINTETN